MFGQPEAPRNLHEEFPHASEAQLTTTEQFLWEVWPPRSTRRPVRVTFRVGDLFDDVTAKQYAQVSARSFPSECRSVLEDFSTTCPFSSRILDDAVSYFAL